MQLPKTTAEQRSEIYEDVRALLNPGFLAHPVLVNGTRLVLRSLNENDWILLQYRSDPRLQVSWKRWTVATSIWMVDGQVVLGNEGALHRVYEMCCKLPANILNDLYEVLNALMRRVREAVARAEAFLYESESRYIWKSEGAQMVETGRLGPGSIGMNSLQKLWTYFNRMEDESERERHDWEMAKFVAGPHVPKGIKKINSKDKQAQGELKKKREGILDRTYYEAQGVIERVSEEKKKKSRFERYDGWEVKIAETEEELQDEMRRWVEGIKDPHDSVIDYVKSKIKTEKETQLAQARAQQEALRRAMEEEGIVRTSGLTPLSGKAGQEFIDRVKSRLPGGTSQVTQDSTHNSAYEKYIKNNPEVGVLRVDDDGNVVSDTKIDPKEMIEMLRKPEEEEGKPTGPDLQELIKSRRPSVDQYYKDQEGGE